MLSVDVTEGEAVAIFLVCLFAISPVLVLVGSLLFPGCWCSLCRRRRQYLRYRALDSSSEGGGLLHGGSEGYLGDNEASSGASSTYGSTATSQSEGSEGLYSRNILNTMPIHVTITWHPLTGWKVKPNNNMHPT